LIFNFPSSQIPHSHHLEESKLLCQTRENIYTTMTIKTSILRLILSIFTLSTVTILNLPAQASSFKPPPGRNAPKGGTAGGGTRPIRALCLASPGGIEGNLTALSPGNHLGLTQSDRPKFLVKLPQSKAKTAEFSLFDEEMNGLYQVTIPVAQKSGLVSIALPKGAPSLVKDKPYYWAFALVCNTSDRTEDLVAGGWIERAEPSGKLKRQLTKVAGVERVSLYAKEGFWYDALTELLDLQRIQLNNPALVCAWQRLVKSVGLDGLAQIPPEGLRANASIVSEEKLSDR
jgi:Domain of Unknown Function (DUF928)